jgi:hypothetical protein
VARLRAENAELRARLDAALKHRFGQRSERRKPKPTADADKPTLVANPDREKRSLAGWIAD